MTFTFEKFELDPARRELRIDGDVQPIQPQVFDLLVYLVEHRERVVAKRELLENLWPDSVVTESSIQRAVSLARAALGSRGAELIQTFPRQGYRFTGTIESRHKSSSPLALRPRYARSADVHIAYTELGSGDIDIVIVNGWIMPMRAMFSHPKVRAVLEALSKIGRVILFDKRGTGLSDRVKDLPNHEQRMDDLRVVLDACKSEQAVLIGFSEGGALAIIYAATYPERARGMVLAGAFARMTRAPGYPFGYPDDAMEKLRGYIRGGWGKGASLRAICPSKATDPEFAEWVAFAEQEGTSPGGAIDLLEMNMRIDLRALLPAVRVPTVVLQADDDKMVDPASGAYLANQIPDAKYVEVEGDDHIFFFGGQKHVLESVEWILAQEPAPVQEDRFLSTALVVGGEHESADEAVWHRHVEHFKGHPVPGAWRAYFDGPVRALRCGEALANDLGVGCGVHTGEVVRRGVVVEGPAFEIASRIARGTGARKVQTSQVVVDLMPGTDLEFVAAGSTRAPDGREIPLFSIALES